MNLYHLYAKSTFFSFLTLLICVSCGHSPIVDVKTENRIVAGQELATISNHLFRFIRKGKFGYINEQGKIAIPAQFSRADDFSEGLAGIEVDGKYGMIDRTGKIVIKPVYEFIYPFKNGQAEFVDIHNNIGLMDRTGKIIKAATQDRSSYTMRAPANSFTDEETEEQVYYSEGLARVYRSNSNSEQKIGKYGYIDRQGKEVIKPQFGYAAEEFHEGLAWVMRDNKLGYIDKQGKIVIEPQFDNHGGCCNGDFHQGLARVHQNGKSGYIDKRGKVLLPIKFDRVAPEFHEGLAWVVTNKKLGFVDRSGKIVIPLQFDYQSMSKDGRVGVTVCNGKYCFSTESSFKNGLAAVKIGQNYKYIDKTGKTIFDSRR
jgi:WG containing repeat